MARSVISFGVLALGLVFAAQATAQEQDGGYITASKLQIDPHMSIMTDGTQGDESVVSPDGPQQAAPQAQVAPGAGIPLDQLGAGTDDQSAPLGDDPMSDNAVETDTVYTA
jgi:hypothetical protein